MSGAAYPTVFLTRGEPASPARRALPAAIASTPPPKSQRSKLWELNESVHCSIIGTCLTTAELRRVLGKVLREDVSRFSDHELHSEAVGLCNRHNQASKALNKALDQRHEIVIKRFAKLQDEVAVLEAWASFRRAGDIPGAYWAVLTHPDIGHAGLKRAFGDVHMLSHLVGAANRADIRRLNALEEENEALRAKVERQQIRLHEAIVSRDDTIRRLSALAAGQIRAETRATEDDALAGLRHLVADLQSRLERETARRERLEQRAAEAAVVAQACEQRAKAAETNHAAAERELAALERHEDPAGDPAAALPPWRVLYVGGRPTAVQQMRALLTEAGGVLLVHDGGRHDHPSLLPGLIGQADVVAFPIDCVSHDAAHTVKRLCRQQSKPWAPLRSSGLGSFLAMLVGRHPEQEVSRSTNS